MKNQGLFHENITMQEHDRREDSKIIRSQHATNLVFFLHEEEKKPQKMIRVIKNLIIFAPDIKNSQVGRP